MVLYNLQNITNSTGPVEYIIAANQVSNGYLIGGLLAGLFVILFISTKNYETADSFSFSAGLIMFLTLMLRFGVDGMITDGVMYFWVAVFALSVLLGLADRMF